jgi:hypothetical protein
LLERRRVKYEVDASSSVNDRLKITHVPDKKPQPLVAENLAHVVLLFLIPTENPNLGEIRMDEATQDRVTERSGATRYQELLFRKHRRLLQ